MSEILINFLDNELGNLQWTSILNTKGIPSSPLHSAFVEASRDLASETIEIPKSRLRVKAKLSSDAS